jgi:hypothetical protein
MSDGDTVLNATSWLMVDFVLMFKVKHIRISSAGVGGLWVGIFSSLQGWIRVWFLCA